MRHVQREFGLDIDPASAQQRFKHELEWAMLGYGFKLRGESPAHLEYGVGSRHDSARAIFASGWLLAAVSGIFRVCRVLLGDRIEVAFRPAAEGCTVEVYGRAGRHARDAVEVLGRPAHWPTASDDPFWPEPSTPADDELLAAWETEGVDPNDLDRITRRALKRAHRGQQQRP